MPQLVPQNRYHCKKKERIGVFHHLWECFLKVVLHRIICCRLYFPSWWRIFLCVVFCFLFKHVAQISIALGRHTLPHVRTIKKYKTCIYDAVTFKGITCGFGLAAVCIAGILPMYLKVIREIQCACRISSEKIHCRKVVSNLYNLGLNMCPVCTFMSCLNVVL